MKEKKQPQRRIPKKSQRAKRRYILFRLKPASLNAKQAFDLVMGQFAADGRKRLGIWFIQFDPETGFGIVRCINKSVSAVKEAIKAIAAEFEPRTVRTSGTLRALRQK